MTPPTLQPVCVLHKDSLKQSIYTLKNKGDNMPPCLTPFVIGTTPSLSELLNIAGKGGAITSA